MKKIAIVTLDGFNELDSFIASAIINRARRAGLEALVTAPGDAVVSMNGVVVRPQAPLEFARTADAVLVGSGTRTREHAGNERLLSVLQLDARRQLLGAQCSGALLLAKLGLLDGVPACTDTKTKPWVEAAGIEVLDQPFVAHGNVATAGGCLASQYLAAWIISRLAGWDLAMDILHYVAPVGEKKDFVERAARALAAQVPAIARASARAAGR